MNNYEFINEQGTFRLSNPHKTSYLYFPLCNPKGMMSSITPTLNGDIKIDQNHFALMPVSQEDLHNSKAGRNFWLDIKGYEPWSATGNSAKQRVMDEDEVTVEAGLLWHKVIRENKRISIKTEVTTYVPTKSDFVELTKVTILNTGEGALDLTPTAAIPIYGRSADNLRDHRHVTALLNRITILENGIVNHPTLSFDERGHNQNHVRYAVMGIDQAEKTPTQFYPVLEEFIGEGGDLDWPQAVVNQDSSPYQIGDQIDGYEAMGGLKFESIHIEPKESYSFVIMIAIQSDNDDLQSIYKNYCSIDGFNTYLEENKRYWEKELNTLSFNTGNLNYDNWLKWVTAQPIFRRIYGCSFLPHHDYGRGGRGWRDLWQDCLALIVMNPENVRYLLLNNFAGVRIDGSNATIIGNQPGEFMADRNNIVRIWMDHGAWPLLTTGLYINNSGDLDFLFETQSYFKDQHISYSRETDDQWDPSQGNHQLDKNGVEYSGTILEHLLIQNLVPFFNVGDHNNIRLEGADWNDGLDMAGDKGESVAFSALYGSNLQELANMLKKAKEKNSIETIEVFEELIVLIDSNNDRISYESVKDKRKCLDSFFMQCNHTVSGKKVRLSIDAIIDDLNRKSEWMLMHIRKNEWINYDENTGWFNGYYDNNGNALERGNFEDYRITLTGQVFTIMSGVADKHHINKILHAANKFLKDDLVGGYRLNNDFHEIKLDMGRLFGFAYGHKENGAMFSHMAVMFANALYKRGYVNEGYEVLNGIFEHCYDFSKSKIYPGIPEYIDNKGRGMYHYLTGSASWLILNVVTEVFGVKGYYGDLLLEPKLKKQQFDNEGTATIQTLFANKIWTIEFENKNLLDVGEYNIQAVYLNEEPLEIQSPCLISRQLLKNSKGCKIVVKLGE